MTPSLGAEAIETFRIEGPHGAILFIADPIHEPSRTNQVARGENEVARAAWLMERLPAIKGGQNCELSFGSVGFGIAGLVTALLAVLVATEIRKCSQYRTPAPWLDGGEGYPQSCSK